MARVAVLKPLSGELVYVDEGDLVAAIDEGYEIPSPKEVAQAELGEKFGGVGSTTGAAVAGALRGATVGTSDILGGYLGLGERIKAYQELEPGVSIGSEIAGATLPILAATLGTAPAGGAGGVAVAGSLAARIAARAPVALAMRAGERAVAGLGLAAAEGAAQGVGRTALRFGAQAAVEGALQGAGREAGQLALDNKLTGERLGQIATAGLVGGGIGLVLGGGIGAGAGLLGKVARRVEAPLGGLATALEAGAAKAPSAAAGNALDDAVARAYVETLDTPSTSRPVTETLLKLRGKLAGKTGAELDDVVRLAEPELRAAALDGEKTIAELVEGKQLAGALHEAQPGSLQADFDRRYVLQQETATLIRNGDLKIATYRGLVASDADRLLAQRNFATEALQQSIDDIDRAILEGKQQYAQTGLPQLKHELMLAQREVQAAFATGGADGAEAAYKALDVSAKRAVGRTTSNFQGLPNMGAQHRRLLTDILEPMYGRLRTGLESEAIWGAAGAQNKRLNAPMSASFDKTGMVMSSWYHGTSYGAHPTNPWLSGRVSNPESIVANITATTKPGTNLAYRAIREQIADETQWQKAVLEIGNLTELPGYRAKMIELAALNARIEKNLVKGAKTAAAQKTLADLGAGTGPLPKWLSPLLGTRTLLRVAEILDNISEGKAGGVASSVAKAADAISKTSVAAAKRDPLVASSAAAFNAKSSNVLKLAEQLLAIQAQVKKETEWMAGQAPIARTEAVASLVRQVDHLKSHLPRGLKAPTPYAADLPPTRAQIQSWLVRLRTVENPASLLDDVANGKLSPEAVDAVRSVYPATFADMQARVVEKLAKLQSEGRAPNQATRTQLGLLLGIPTDPLLMPAAMRAIQGIYPPVPTAGPPGASLPARRGPLPNLSKNYQSGSEEIALSSKLK